VAEAGRLDGAQQQRRWMVAGGSSGEVLRLGGIRALGPRSGRETRVRSSPRRETGAALRREFGEGNGALAL
jgi:hypothetical protein